MVLCRCPFVMKKAGRCRKNEEDLSAEKKAAFEGTWVPQAHAHIKRAKSFVAQESEGTCKAFEIRSLQTASLRSVQVFLGVPAKPFANCLGKQVC